jgi:hypothetical protein
MSTYEEQLNSDAAWAIREGSMHFENESAVHRTLQQISTRLSDAGVPYAIAGGMALFFHGFRRFTEDVDILIDRDDLNRIHETLDGHGYLPLFEGSKNLRDTETGVKIEFLLSGDFPGDGKPKPVSFPNPEAVAVELNDTMFLSLEALVELKLASGMTNAMRLQDLADVQRVILELDLRRDFADRLDPYVQKKFIELFEAVEANRDDR